MKSVYLVLDMQNDLVHADSGAGKSPMGELLRQRRVLENTQLALERARSAGIAVGFVRVGFSPDYHECPANSPLFGGAPKAGMFKLGTWGTEIHPWLEQRTGDIQVVKHRVSPFYSTTLMAQLSAAGTRRIYCSGVSTQAVVQATVRDAHDRDFDVVVIEDASCAHSEQEHLNSIQSISRFCRVEQAAKVDFSQ
jgi:nicotinamidase-related amidase